uniref:Uncharacterized protein n=1 Tax=Moniliophthora roreri TaxID=221103 RepID=A0A0W0FYK9_MONRR
MNSEHYEEELATAINASSERNRAIYGSLIFLRAQRRQMMENMTRVDRHMGQLAQQITDDETFTITGAIVVPPPALDIANLPLHVVLPDTDPDGDHFATDDDVKPNDPAFIRKAITHRRGLKRASEISKGQHLLQLRQRAITSIPSPNIPQTELPERMDASTSRTSRTPLGATTPETMTQMSPTPAEEPQNSLSSPLLPPRPQCLPAMNSPPPLPMRPNLPERHTTQQGFLQNSRTPYASPPPLSQSTQTPNVPIVSVWDDEDAEAEDRDSQTELRSNNPTTHTTALLNEVHQELSVLCVNWENTAPSTVWTMSARFATLIKLAISLDIVGTEEGLRELRDETIPAVHRLLTTIGEMIPHGTMPTTGMENSLGITAYRNTTPPRAPFTAAEEADLDDQLEVANQLLNSDPEQTPRRITRSRRRGAVESLQTERTETEAKSSETDPFDKYRNIFHTPTSEMTTPSGSAAAASDVKPKVEHDDTDEQWARTISTAVLQTIDDKKDEAIKANTDEKKKMLLLSLVKGNTSEWKQRETMKLFPEDDDPEEKKKAAEETWKKHKPRSNRSE